jgi:hypothetical protein
VQNAYNKYKGDGLAESMIPSAIEMRFFANKSILRGALNEGMVHQDKMASALISNEQIIQKLLDKQAFDVYKPYFEGIKRYDAEADLKHEIEFLTDALTVMNNF